MATRILEAVVSGGMGGFLCPPGHPEHSFHVEADLNRRPENRGGISLSSALNEDWIHVTVCAKVARLLGDWECSKLPLTNPAVQDWIHQVLGYFKTAYLPASGSRNVADLRFTKNLDPLENADIHAGVAFIRDYYPAYQPTAADFAAAYWGTKPPTS